MVYVIKVVIIVGTQSTLGVLEWLSMSIVTSSSFNHREELDSTVQLQMGQVARCSWCVVYIAQGYLQGIMSAKRMHEVW